MKIKELIWALEHLKWLSSTSEYSKVYIEDLIYKIRTEGIKSNTYHKSLKQINIKSQCWTILNFLQNNPTRRVTGSDFTWGFLKVWPFVWYSASARLSELLRYWLIKKVWNIKGIKRFLYPSRDRDLYTITTKGLNYKLKQTNV